MNKWRKRVLLLALFLGVFAGTSGMIGWWLARGAPEWYDRRKMAPQEAEAAAGRAEQQLQRTLSWAQDRQAEALRRSQIATTMPSAPLLEISFTQDELNGFFQKWDTAFGWSEGYRRYLSEPRVVLRDGRLILAATVADAGAVLSVEFQPRLEAGGLWVPVTRVLAGRLPLPRVIWDRYRTRVESRIAAGLPQWQHDARMSEQGANCNALAAAMGELLLDMLNDRPAPPVLFLPYDMRNKPRSLPVKLTGVQIAGQTLSLTVEPMDVGQQKASLDAIRHYTLPDTATAGAGAPSAP